jgi:hypothetical protein
VLQLPPVGEAAEKKAGVPMPEFIG